MVKRYINVAYKDRDMAKRLGARWDPSVKRWYCPPGSALAKVYSWRKAGGHDDALQGGGAAQTDGVPSQVYKPQSHDRTGRNMSETMRLNGPKSVFGGGFDTPNDDLPLLATSLMANPIRTEAVGGQLSLRV